MWETLKTESSIQIVNNHLIASISASLDEDGLINLSRTILQAADKNELYGVVINMSAVTILGSHGFSILKKLAHTIELMGIAVAFVGFQPGVVVALIDLDVDITDITAAATTEDAFDLFAARSLREEQLLQKMEGEDDIERENAHF